MRLKPAPWHSGCPAGSGGMPLRADHEESLPSLSLLGAHQVDLGCQPMRVLRLLLANDPDTLGPTRIACWCAGGWSLFGDRCGTDRHVRAGQLLQQLQHVSVRPTAVCPQPAASSAKGEKTVYRISGRSDRISSTVHRSVSQRPTAQAVDRAAPLVVTVQGSSAKGRRNHVSANRRSLHARP
jgi:hypothetical protein